MTHTARGIGSELTRTAALRALADKWPDQTTRELLEQRAVQDDSGYPRRAALWALADKWPDQTTRELLEQRAVQDDNQYTRSTALEALAKQWPDRTTLKLLESQVSSFEQWWIRQEIEESIEALRRKLAEETRRELLKPRVVQDDDRGSRRRLGSGMNPALPTMRNETQHNP